MTEAKALVGKSRSFKWACQVQRELSKRAREESTRASVGRLLKRTLYLSVFLACTAPAWACPSCQPLVQEGVYNAEWWGRAAALSAPFWVVGAIGWRVWKLDF
jgi:hypothetical protein